MPPKKKSRVPVKPSPESTKDNPQAVTEATPTKVPRDKTIDSLASDGPILSDGWTDEQETTLFKAISIYRWKPAGKY